MDKLELRLDYGQTILDGLLKRGIAFDHECGGTLACGSCGVVVRSGLEQLRPATEDEADMLERVGAYPAAARLACQAVSQGGTLVVEIPHAEARRSDERPPSGALRIALSERAATHLAAQLEKRPGSVAVRIAVEPAGCSGLRYRLGHADAIGADDTVFERQGIRIAVDRRSLPHVQGVAIDLVQEGLTRKLHLQNPDVRQTCGCGESFAL